MKFLVITIITFVLAVGLGHFISDDAGFVIIGYGDKVFRTSVVVFVVILAILWTALSYAWWALYRVLTLKSWWMARRGDFRAKRSKRALSNGLVALAEGDFSRAERLLSRGADGDSDPAIHYMGAAEAAQAQNETERRDHYFSLAREAMPTAEVAIGIKRAQMQLANQQSEQARATLDYLADRHPENKQVLGLQQQVYADTGDMRALLGLLPALRRHRVYDIGRLAEIEAATATALLLVPISSLEDLQQVWNVIPKAVRGHGSSVAGYTRQLATLGQHAEAERLLRKNIAHEWHADTIRLYGDIRIPNAALQLERAESWLASRSDDHDLLLALAKLSIAAELWGKSRAYLNQIIAIAPSPITYRLLAEVHEQAAETEAAMKCRREGLRLATSGAVGLPAVGVY